MEGNAVRNWFKQGKDYHSGVLLLRKFGKDTTRYDAYLNRIPPNFLSFQLQTALESCAAMPLKVETGVSTVATIPTQVTAWKSEARKWHKLESDNHSRLHFATTKEARQPIVIERMTVIAPALDELYRKIRLYEQTGQVEIPKPEPEATIVPLDVQSINQLWQEKGNLESRLSRIRQQEKYRAEVITKFTRLYDIHKALQLPFEKQLSDYLP
jgi:hypothetical protein